MRFLEHEIDPSTVRVSVDVPFLEHLEELVQIATYKALIHQKTSTIYADKDESGHHITYRDYDQQAFESQTIQCPQEADALWLEQQGEPRPFPSIVVKPPQSVIVSKPSLCEGCIYRLEKNVVGHCHNKHYKALT